MDTLSSVLKTLSSVLDTLSSVLDTVNRNGSALARLHVEEGESEEPWGSEFRVSDFGFKVHVMFNLCNSHPISLPPRYPIKVLCEALGQLGQDESASG